MKIENKNFSVTLSVFIGDQFFLVLNFMKLLGVMKSAPISDVDHFFKGLIWEQASLDDRKKITEFYILRWPNKKDPKP